MILNLECLESRIVPSETTVVFPPPLPPAGVTAVFNGGNLTVTGTDEADNVRITKVGDQAKVFSGETELLSATISEISLISVDLKDGSDTFNCESLDLPTSSTFWVSGGDGNDDLKTFTTGIMHGDGGNDTLAGSSGDDYLWGDAGVNYISGMGGNDMLFAGNQGDKINGGSGDDIIYGGDGNDKLWGGVGSDTIYGMAGNDRISTYYFLDELPMLQVMQVDFANDRVYGGDGDDIITTPLSMPIANGYIYIFGEKGSDEIHVEETHAFVEGGDDIDYIYSGYTERNTTNYIDGCDDVDIIWASASDAVVFDFWDYVFRP